MTHNLGAEPKNKLDYAALLELDFNREIEPYIKVKILGERDQRQQLRIRNVHPKKEIIVSVQWKKENEIITNEALLWPGDMELILAPSQEWSYYSHHSKYLY